MSLSRLERMQEAAEEERLAKLRTRAKLDAVDDRKRAQRAREEELEHLVFCFNALEDNVWYYRDRAGLPRGPLQLTMMRACWVNGVIDDKTLVWGQGLENWYPVRNVVGLPALIQSFDTKLFTWLHDKFILQPRLEAVRKQRKELAKAARTGAVQLPPAIREALAADPLPPLKAPEHPFDRVIRLKLAALDAQEATTGAGAEQQAPTPGAGRPAAAACLSMALPLPRGVVPGGHWGAAPARRSGRRAAPAAGAGEGGAAL